MEEWQQRHVGRQREIDRRPCENQMVPGTERAKCVEQHVHVLFGREAPRVGEQAHACGQAELAAQGPGRGVAGENDFGVDAERQGDDALDAPFVEPRRMNALGAMTRSQRR